MNFDATPTPLHYIAMCLYAGTGIVFFALPVLVISAIVGAMPIVLASLLLSSGDSPIMQGLCVSLIVTDSLTLMALLGRFIVEFKVKNNAWNVSRATYAKIKLLNCATLALSALIMIVILAILDSKDLWSALGILSAITRLFLLGYYAYRKAPRQTVPFSAIV